MGFCGLRGFLEFSTPAATAGFLESLGMAGLALDLAEVGLGSPARSNSSVVALQCRPQLKFNHKYET